MSNNQYRININQNIYSYNNQMRPRVNNNNNPYTNQIDPGKNTVEAYKDIFGNNTIPSESRTNKPEIKYNYNIIHYDENLTNFTENKYFSSNLKMELEGTYYGINNYKLFQDICNKIKEKSQHSRNPKKYILISSGSCATKIFDYCTTININQIVLYYIFCLNIPQYLPLKNIYPKLKYVYSSFESLERDIFSNTDLKNINPIKSSNLFFLEDYNNIYIKLHFEIVKKYSLYKLLKLKNFKENEFMKLIETKNPYYKDLAKDLTFNDDELIIQYFKEHTNESEENLRKYFNKNHNIDQYIKNYTKDNFYYRYINRFLREGDFASYRILSNHLSKFIYHLYDYRNTHYQLNNTTLYRKITLKLDELNIYSNSIGKIICYPSFTSTSLGENDYHFDIFKKPEFIYTQLIIQLNYSKSIVNIKELSNFPKENEYLFLPFSFFKINNVERFLQNEILHAKIYLTALNSEKPIEDMYLYFMQNYSDNLDPEGLDMLILTNDNSTTLIINPELINFVKRK